jgi:hypothetical protein
MKPAFVSAFLVAASLTLGGCAHSPDQMSAISPSQLSVTEINAELAALSAEASALYRNGDRLAGVAPLASQAPTRLYVSDSNGVLLTAYTPGDARDYSSFASFRSSSRPFGYARLEALAKRRAELYAELNLRGRAPR